MRRPPFSVAGAAGVALGCTGMAAMLPSAVASALGVLGISGSGALARTLSPVAEPLFIASAALILVGALACSRFVVLLAAAGTTLLYLSMFQLASGAATGGGSMSMMSMHQSGRTLSLHADATSFYLGLVLLLGALLLTALRRHQHKCRPLVRLPRLLVARR